MGSVRFGVPRRLVLWLKNACNIRVFVETGTNRAETAVWASDNFEKVITVEGYEPLYRQAVERFGSRSNIRFILGDSRSQAKHLVDELTEPAIFWLDAHWCGEHTFGRTDECPVAGELQALNSSSLPHVILIDDARLFLAPPPAPHNADQWPDIATVCQMLTASLPKRYVAVHDDVIITVPGHARSALIDFLRTDIEKDSKPAIAGSSETRIGLRQLLSRLKRRAGSKSQEGS